MSDAAARPNGREQDLSFFDIKQHDFALGLCGEERRGRLTTGTRAQMEITYISRSQVISIWGERKSRNDAFVALQNREFLQRFAIPLIQIYLVVLIEKTEVKQ